jgi:hypothetical protein
MVHAHSDAHQSEGIRYIAEPIRRVFRKQDPIEAIVRSFNTVPYLLQHMDSLILEHLYGYTVSPASLHEWELALTFNNKSPISDIGYIRYEGSFNPIYKKI